MSKIKLVLWIVVVLLVSATVFAFTSVNTGVIHVDLLFTEVTTSIPVAFTVAFAVGWLFGLACISIWALRLVNQRRSLRRSLKVSESEVTSLRNLPLSDAD